MSLSALKKRSKPDKPYVQVKLEDFAEGTWQYQALEEQQTWFERLGDRHWDLITDTNDELILEKKVGFACFGPPTITKSTEKLGYSPEAMKEIIRISETIRYKCSSYSKDQSIYFACIFVCLETKDKKAFTIPVFKTMSKTEIFIDSTCRVYKSWASYLASNTLPKCQYCYPRGGSYDDESCGNDGLVRAEFGSSPATSAFQKTMKTCDKLSFTAGMWSLGVGIASLVTLPVSAPIVAAASAAATASSVYSMYRGAYCLKDLKSHGKSIALTDDEARLHWMTLLGSGLGLARFRILGSISRAAQSGEALSRVSKAAFLAVRLGCISVSGLEVLNQCKELADKPDLTEADLVNFLTSLLFFRNELMSIQTVGSILQDMHSRGAADCDGVWNKLRKFVSRGEQGGTSRGKGVKLLNKITDQEGFYHALVELPRLPETRLGPPDDSLLPQTDCEDRTPKRRRIDEQERN